MNTFELSRAWFEFSFNNPEKINPWHSAVYFFAIEHCNRLGWKEKFWFPSQMVMEAIGIRNWKTYSKYLNDLVDWGFIKMIETSKNQYSSNIIALVKNTKATTKALDKALSKHSTKHSQSIASIDKQETRNKKQETSIYETKVSTLQELMEKNIDINFYINKWINENTVKQEMNKFYNYRVQKNEWWKKEHWEKQKTFDTKRRFATWLSNTKALQPKKWTWAIRRM
mgnify:CR=1 FL=1